ncbi:TPM domain-containing protein [Cytophaga sp. FL35]|uniref:TPM domain-containing protein n=1 Tax=Cytophaga sp. FL35 TaxID=1904456 RepID=UPI001653B1C7|nr:TPM domain-containing protein [Cytophaga sp. FL35]MBC6999441.1 TPM domain-containing protein [Cytophaga sp. FL35]
MSRVEDFLTSVEEKEVVQAIIEAENSTSGEIRVHLEAHTRLEAMERAKEVFHQLKMDNTKDNNGVLIYVAVNDRKFAICGDKGIDNVVPKGFWNTTKDTIQSHFKKGEFKQGLVEGILKAGHELKVHFPWQQDDKNELSDEISKG